ncbi:MAG: ral secretion pathway protein [Gemmatimonadetes bacterium]|nr:ral secretion pathway protein [Gemmatimonadota bacterium]
MLTNRARLRKGFTLAEVIVSITLVAILSAVVVPVVRGRFQDGYENSLIQEFSTLAAGINAYRQDIGKYPPKLDYLSAIPAVGTAKDFCGNLLAASDWAKWRGPYVSRMITNSPAYYVVAQSDSVQDLLTRPAGFLNTIQIQIVGPDTVTTVHVDLKIDGSVLRTGGTLLWSSGAGVSTEMRYVIPTRTNGC